MRVSQHSLCISVFIVEIWNLKYWTGVLRLRLCLLVVKHACIVDRVMNTTTTSERCMHALLIIKCVQELIINVPFRRLLLLVCLYRTHQTDARDQQ